MPIHKEVYIKKINTKKFKDVGFRLEFVEDANPQRVCERAILTYMLQDHTKHYASKEKMQTLSDDLYGLQLEIDSFYLGKAHVLDMYISGIHPTYTNDAYQFIDMYNMMKEVLYYPDLNEEAFIEAKNIMKAKWMRQIDKPARYANMRALEIAGKDNTIGKTAIEQMRIVDHITLEGIQQAYEDLLTNEVCIYVCGDVKDEELFPLLEVLEVAENNKPFASATYYAAKNDLESAYIEEYRNISQTNISMIWFTNIDRKHELYPALCVANAMFGQYPTSLLFNEVREKHSLCYSIFSRIIAFDGVLSLSTGIDAKNIKKTIALIQQQFEVIKNGSFEKELFEITKKMLINSYKSSNDYKQVLTLNALENTVLNQKGTIEDKIKSIQNVRIEDISRVWQQLTHKLTFVLTKEDSYE